jgi:hypothetical protein
LRKFHVAAEAKTENNRNNRGNRSRNTQCHKYRTANVEQQPVIHDILGLIVKNLKIRKRPADNLCIRPRLKGSFYEITKNSKAIKARTLHSVWENQTEHELRSHMVHMAIVDFTCLFRTQYLIQWEFQTEKTICTVKFKSK